MIAALKVLAAVALGLWLFFLNRQSLGLSVPMSAVVPACVTAFAVVLMFGGSDDE